ncbi:MAG TPA: hypothetical protein VHB73_04415 [Alphaproteobacteria bacterium]|nr:hypothetical protein [Alphaproteobacteria bacterium]
MNRSEKHWLEKFRLIEALWEYGGQGPHAQFENEPYHAGFFLNTDVIAGHPDVVRDIANEFAPEFHHKTTWVMTYTPSIAGARALAVQLAHKLHARVGHIDVRTGEVYAKWRKGDSVALVTDELISNIYIDAALDIVHEKQVKLVGPLCVLNNISGQTHHGKLPVKGLLERLGTLWPAHACPLCRQGSTPLPAHRGWHSLVHKEESQGA